MRAEQADERVQDFGEWLNEWGSVDGYRRTREWKDGYEQAISDAYERFEKAFPKWPKGGLDRA